MGRIKIKYALKQKQVSEYSIKKALKAIEDNEYNKTLAKLVDQKLKTLKAEKNIFIKKRKLQDHLMQKGYETDIILTVLLFADLTFLFFRSILTSLIPHKPLLLILK